MTTTLAPPLCKPFLKWTGSKQKLLPELVSRLPKDIDQRTYHEPFLGGGSLFWHLLPRSAFLSDANADLINCYRVVRDNVGQLIDLLQRHKDKHCGGVLPETYFNSIRSSYNSQKLTPVEKAAAFIYLNKTCFNGLYRVNGSGGFNVPMGKYKKPLILDEQRLRACSEILNDPSRYVKLAHSTYEFLDHHASSRSFVYLDPPYEPVSKTSSFTGYGKNGFTPEDQRKLKLYCDSLSRTGAKWMLSNSVAPLILDLYKDYYIEFVSTRRSISASSASRGDCQEVIARNYRNA